MLRAISHTRSSETEPFGTVILGSEDRHLHRQQITTNQGDDVTVDLPEPVLLADGDMLVLEDGRTIEIIASKEKLYEVRAGKDVPLSHLAWHLGGRHLAAQIDEDRILIPRNRDAHAILQGLGASVTEVIERFQPVHGADHDHDHGHAHAEAHSHTSHSHSHSQSHSHAHSHGHSHAGHGHEHAQGKRDKFGRLPGDPHYGHNHG